MSLGLAFLTAVAAAAAEPVARATDYDDVHILVLDPEKSGGVVRERARRDPIECADAGNGIKTASGPRDLPALRYGFVQDPNGIRFEVVKRNIKP